MALHIDLIVPGLSELPCDELDSSFIKLELPALNQILCCARRDATQAFDLESMLIQSMGWDGHKTLPFAQIFKPQANQNSTNSLLFKAVHLKADMHSAIALPLEIDRVNYDDITLIINDLKDLFKVDCDITEVQRGLWLMDLKQCTPAQHYPHYLSIIGKKVDPYIEQSRISLPWYKLINEIQMFMHQHDINRDRLASGLLPINSLWFWGAGDLSKLTASSIDWYCDDELLQQFANASSIDCAKLNAVKTHDFKRDSIIIDMSILEALKIPADTDLQIILTAMEKCLFKPLLQRVKSNQCNLTLKSGSSCDLSLNRYSTWQWWKKSTSLIDFTRP